MKNTSGKETKQNKPLYRLLRKFRYCLEQCDDTKPRDVAYWYGERSLTALLATSAWLTSDGWSLEEFTGERRKGKRPKVTPGRGDLWLLLGRRKYTIEAKVTWPQQITDYKKWKGRVNNKISLAFTQLSHLSKAYRYGLPVAVCYVVPAIPRNRWTTTKSSLSFSMKNFVRIMTEENTSIAAMACWYTREKDVPSDGRGDAKTFYPGIAAVMHWKDRFPKRARR